MSPLVRHYVFILEVLVLVAVVVIFGIFYFIQWQGRAFVHNAVSEVPPAQAALVLGASVIGTSTLSLVLRERADAALVLYRAHIVEKILVTGDNAALSHNEVDPVGKYLFAAGIPKEDIFLDHAGFDTYSSMYRARDVFAVRSLVIVSQAQHLPRAVFIARSLGLSAYGFSAQSGGWYLGNTLREMPASIKAFLDVVFLRVPKYLGEQFPITESAIGTWPQ